MIASVSGKKDPKFTQYPKLAALKVLARPLLDTRPTSASVRVFFHSMLANQNDCINYNQ
jgi:hypothetical protein